jgi:ABC-type nitrate/sulfonate/bicarbonate transport system substrate-binding protein
MLAFACGGLALVFLPSCAKEKPEIILQREWTANAEYAGDLCAAEYAQQHDGRKFTVREGSELLDPVRVVRSAGAQFGVASADRILRENEGGAGLVILGSATCKSPVIFLSRQAVRVDSPRDFIGKTVGIQAGTNTELVFDALLEATHVARDSIRVVESGWGIQTFLTGDIDILGAFAYDEPIQLELKGVHYAVTAPEQYGVRYVGTVYFTRRQLIDTSPELVQAFMDELVAGWSNALSNRDHAIELLGKYRADVDLAKEKKSLERGAEYFKGDGDRLLFSSRERWNEMAASLIELGRLKSFDYDQNVDYRFLEKALSGSR